MLRWSVKLVSNLAFVVSLCLVAAQGALMLADVFFAVIGKEPIFMIVAGTGAPTASSIAIALWLYFSLTAYAAFWFVAGMGLRQFSSHASE